MIWLSALDSMYIYYTDFWPSCKDSLVTRDIGLHADGRQFEPYLNAACVCMLVAPLWLYLGCCSRTVDATSPKARQHFHGRAGGNYDGAEAVYSNLRCRLQPTSTAATATDETRGLGQPVLVACSGALAVQVVIDPGPAVY